MQVIISGKWSSVQDLPTLLMKQLADTKISPILVTHDFEKLWERIPSENVGVLLDLGHLKVTSHWLGFDKYQFVERLKDRVFAIHLHENNGQLDEHKELDKTSWCFEVIGRKCFSGIPIVVESFGPTVDQIVQQVRLIEKILGEEAPPKAVLTKG